MKFLPIIYIINKSFIHGIFRLPWKKKDEKHSASNYRPILILSDFSKISEKVMVVWLLNYLFVQSLITDCQFGFRPKYSTELAIQNLCQHMNNLIDAKLFHITVFCNIKSIRHYSTQYTIKETAFLWCVRASSKVV